MRYDFVYVLQDGFQTYSERLYSERLLCFLLHNPPPVSPFQPDVQSLPVEDAGVHVISRRQQQQLQKEQHRNRKRQQDGAEDDDAAMLTERLDGLSMGAGGASAHRDGGGSRRRSRDEAQGRDQHEQDIALQSRGAQLESKHAGERVKFRVGKVSCGSVALLQCLAHRRTRYEGCISRFARA